jgi:hypothetical protein
MDIYDYNEEHLSLVAGNCKYLSFKQLQKPTRITSGVSCSECRSWTGSGCKRQLYENIASELQLD